MRISFACVALSAILLMPQVANAGVMNGSFDTDYTGWDTFGLNSVFGAPAGKSLSETQGTTNNRDDLNDFLFGVGSSVSLDVELGATVLGGSAIKQSISVTAGDELSFDWNFVEEDSFLSSDTSDAIAFWTLSDGVNVLASRFTSPATNATSVPGFDLETGVNSVNETLVSGGTFVLGFGVIRVSPAGTLDAGIVIDNVSLTGASVVPEPTSVATWGLLVGAVAAVRRRRI